MESAFFRRLSYQLFGTQEEHSMIRSIVYRMEKLNKDAFSRFLMPGVNNETIDEHIRMISAPHTWATQVPAASVFQVPLYYCTQEQNIYKRNVVKPFFNKECPLKLPAFPQSDNSITLLRPTHFELYYYENCHYDAIVSTTTGKVSSTPPPLSTSHSDLFDLTVLSLWIFLYIVLQLFPLLAWLYVPHTSVLYVLPLPHVVSTWPTTSSDVNKMSARRHGHLTRPLLAFCVRGASSRDYIRHAAIIEPLPQQSGRCPPLFCCTYGNLPSFAFLPDDTHHFFLCV